MVADIIFGAVIAVPMLAGLLGFPLAVWKSLDQRYLNKRGVAVWKKVWVGLLSMVPAVITLVLFGFLTELLEMGPASSDWQRARELHPRGIPPQAIPMALGMFGGIFFLTPLYKKLWHYLPRLNVFADTAEPEPAPARTQHTELHPLEWYVKSMFLDHRSTYIGAVELSEIPAFAGSPPHIKACFYRQFLDAEFLLIVKRNVDAANLTTRDIKYSLNTAIVAENNDCLQEFRSLARAPVAKITGARLLDYLKDDASVVIKQPEMQLTLVAADLNLMREMLSAKPDKNNK